VPHRKEISVDALRMERSPLPAFGHPLARQAGEENPSERLVIARAAPLLVIARAAGPWQSSSFQPARSAADAAALVLAPDSVFLAPSQTFLAPSQIDLASSQTFLAPGQIDLASSQTFLAPGQIDLAPSQTFLAPSQIDLAPSQTFLAPGQIDLAPGQIDLASSQIPPAPSQIDPVWHPPCSLEEFPSPAWRGRVPEGRERASFQPARSAAD
jgi:hypothetical protein